MLALGGGVIGDMTGFAAACYQRGVDFVQVPTTVMAQVDSSVGGKTGVNHPLGKNMIGAFYQPRVVLIDTDTLHSLPDRELASGISEIIKYGLIRDADLFVWLEQNMAKLLARDGDALAYAVERSCVNKAEVVAQDEREGGVRATLNLGHTFGHAIETHTGYGSWLHGEAVAAGMVMAADMSHRLGWIDRGIVDRCVIAPGILEFSLSGAVDSSWVMHFARVALTLLPLCTFCVLCCRVSRCACVRHRWLCWCNAEHSQPARCAGQLTCLCAASCRWHRRQA